MALKLTVDALIVQWYTTYPDVTPILGRCDTPNPGVATPPWCTIKNHIFSRNLIPPPISKFSPNPRFYLGERIVLQRGCFTSNRRSGKFLIFHSLSFPKGITRFGRYHTFYVGFFIH